MRRSERRAITCQPEEVRTALPARGDLSRHPVTSVLMDPCRWLTACAAALVGCASWAATPAPGRICGLALARQGCGVAHAQRPCAESTTPLPGWRLRLSGPGAAAAHRVLTTASDGTFDAAVPPGAYHIASAESRLAGLAEPLTVQVGPDECVRVEFTVQLLRP